MLATVLIILLLATLFSAAVAAQSSSNLKHVLLISVDGMHALDVARFVDSHPHSALAELSRHGITYSNVRTPANSDSFPGLLALVTGGSPITHGLFYDVSYDRKLFDPTNTTCAGPAGNTMVYDESIDLYSPANVSRDAIDPTKLPRRLDEHSNCVLVYPHSALKTNTIFEAVKAAGGHTAWADKHPAYDVVNGPSGKGVDDLYTPEITNVNGFDATVSVVCTVENDQKKVRGVINEIHGLEHNGSRGHGVPAVFGMNFQPVSVGQKLAQDNADPSCNLADGNALRGKSGKLKFNDPATDSRTPDIIVQPVYGTIYTHSSKKNAEHGGFSFGDTNVGLIVSNPDLPAHVVKTPVASSQVAPTILKALGLNPNQLKAVRQEKTEVLPELPF